MSNFFFYFVLHTLQGHLGVLLLNCFSNNFYVNYAFVIKFSEINWTVLDIVPKKNKRSSIYIIKVIRFLSIYGTEKRVGHKVK